MKDFPAFLPFTFSKCNFPPRLERSQEREMLHLDDMRFVKGHLQEMVHPDHLKGYSLLQVQKYDIPLI
jgi:hypothetical protein